MTQTELVKMLISKCNGLTEQNKSLQIDLQEAAAVTRDLKSTVRCTVDALSVAKGGYQVRKQNQGTVEHLRDAVLGLIWIVENESEDKEATVTFARNVLSMTEEVSY
jgi:hypothetical protein